jgi:hypothetical protein
MISKKVADDFATEIEAIMRKAGTERPFDLAKRAFEWLSQNLELLRPYSSHSALSQFIQTREAEVEPYLPLMLGLLQLLPEIMEREEARVAERWAKKHPVETSPGRPRKVNDDAMKRQVRDSILDLFAGGTPLSVAQERTAERYDMSLRSVQRIWKERETLGKTKPESIREFLAAIDKM